MNKTINDLTKQEFDSEFKRLMPTIPIEQQLPKHIFCSILVQKGILDMNKMIEFLQE